MKVVVLAGGLGTRMAEVTEVRPKAMVEIGGLPILWHILKHYAHFGFKESVVALGYKGDAIKRFFIDRTVLEGDMTVELGSGKVIRRRPLGEDWTVHLVETGTDAGTGGRLKRLGRVVRGEPFLLTYGDGVSDLDLNALVAFHRSHGKLVTVTAVRPAGRFGVLDLAGERVSGFAEKPRASEGWINGGFFVVEPAALDRIPEDQGVFWERGPLERLASEGQLMAYRHDGFWQCMDTLRDKRFLESLWDSGKAPWKVWA